jgi:hypothetical protein
MSFWIFESLFVVQETERRQRKAEKKDESTQERRSKVVPTTFIDRMTRFLNSVGGV